MYTPLPSPTPLSQATFADRYETPAGRSFMRGMEDALQTTLPAIASSMIEQDLARQSDPLTEQQWRESPWHREGLAYEKGMTADLAAMMAERHDRRALDAFYAEHSGAGAGMAGLAGSFIGSIPDPLNFIPILGMLGLEARVAARTGRVAGRILSGSLDASLGEAALQPLIGLEHNALQDPFDFEMAAMNIAMAAGVGAAFGTLRAAFSHFSASRRAALTAKAVADILEGRPVDVAPVTVPPRSLHAQAAAVLDAVAARADLPADSPLRARMAELEAEVRAVKQAGQVLDALTSADPMAARDIPELRAIRITDEMRRVAADYSAALAEADTVATLPGMGETPARAAAYDDMATGRLRAQAEQRMSDAILAGIPASDRADVGTGLEAVRATAGEAETTARAQAAELSRQADAANAEAQALPEGDRGRAAALERAQTLRESAAALEQDAEFYRAVRETAAPVTEPDYTVGRPTEQPDDVEAPSLKASELYEPDDTELSLVEARFKDLEEAGEVPAAARDDLDAAEHTAGRLARMAEAVQVGFACLLRPS